MQFAVQLNCSLSICCLLLSKQQIDTATGNKLVRNMLVSSLEHLVAKARWYFLQEWVKTKQSFKMKCRTSTYSAYQLKE